MRSGRTAFCPTTVTQTEEVLKKASETLVKAKETQETGAKILGINFEGPFWMLIIREHNQNLV